MAVKKQGVSFEGIMHDLEQGKFAPAYILMGEESYYIDRISDFIAEHALQPEERDFNQDIIYGLDTSASQVTLMARAYPMMAERRVVIVKEAQGMSSLQNLAAYFEGIQPTTILVVCYKNGTIDRRKELIKRAEAAGAIIFEAQKLRDYELPAFIQNHVKIRKATIDNKSAIMLADAIGTDLNRLLSEIDKLLSILPEDNKKITPELVEKHVGVSKEFNPFELRNAIVNKDIFKAYEIVRYFDKNPKSGSVYVIVPALYSYFSNLMVAHYAPEKNNQAALADYIGVKSGWGMKDYITGMRNYSPMKTMQIIQKLREVAAKSKGIENRSVAPGDLMNELIHFILH